MDPNQFGMLVLIMWSVLGFLPYLSCRSFQFCLYASSCKIAAHAAPVPSVLTFLEPSVYTLTCFSGMLCPQVPYHDVGSLNSSPSIVTPIVVWWFVSCSQCLGRGLLSLLSSEMLKFFLTWIRIVLLQFIFFCSCGGSFGSVCTICVVSCSG